MVRNAREEILRVFAEELKTKPMEKIRVKDIISRTGISHNTFYYHFDDIFDLLHALLEREKERLAANIYSTDSWQDILRSLIRYARTYQTEIYHIYNSVPRERIERYFSASTESIMYHIVLIEAMDLHVDAEDIRCIADFYRCAIIGFFMQFLWSDMKMDVDEEIDRLALIFRDNIHTVLQRCEERNNKKEHR